MAGNERILHILHILHLCGHGRELVHFVCGLGVVCLAQRAGVDVQSGLVAAVGQHLVSCSSLSVAVVGRSSLPQRLIVAVCCSGR